MKLKDNQKYFLHWVVTKMTDIGVEGISKPLIRGILVNDEYNGLLSFDLNKLGIYYEKMYKETIGKEHYYNTQLKGKQFTINKTSTVYRLSRIENEKVVVRWKTSAGDPEWVTYRLNDVFNYINKEQWNLTKL